MIRPTLAITFLSIFLSSCAANGINQPTGETKNNPLPFEKSFNKLPPAEFGIGGFKIMEEQEKKKKKKKKENEGNQGNAYAYAYGPDNTNGNKYGQYEDYEYEYCGPDDNEADCE